MTDAIEITKLDLVERLLIPMQNISTLLSFVEGGRLGLSADELLAGLTEVRTNVDAMADYLWDLKDGKQQERTLRLEQTLKMLDENLARPNILPNRAAPTATQINQPSDGFLNLVSS